ncbi:hypothetical protein ACFLYH_01880 [Candidatus Dependentiae bacterium]
MFENIYYYNGKIIFNDLDKDTILFLKKMEISEKDLLFIEYSNGFSLDVDWNNGVFFVSIIQYDDWDNRLVKRKYKNIDELEVAIKNCIAEIQTMIQ